MSENSTSQQARQANVELANAVYEGSLEGAKKALSQGADPNGKNEGGFPMLCLAMMGRHMKSDQSALEMAALLIESGARDELRDLDGRGALFLAVERDGPAGLILALAAAGGKPSQADLNGETPLMAAADENQAWAAAELLLCGADPSARDDEDKTALDIAWESESFETARAIEAFLEGQALDKATPRAPPGGKRAGL